jgi:hypothetical protein
MNDIRAKFEEIWPAPEGVYWYGEYSTHLYSMLVAAREHNARLDTFTRCQETMAPVMSLVDEMIADIRYRAYHDADDEDDEKSKALLYRAKQILGERE